MPDTQFDVLTIGNAIVDVIAPIDPGFLELHGMDEGHPSANGYDDKHEMIPWDDGRVVRVPKFIFYNRGTS